MQSLALKKPNFPLNLANAVGHASAMSVFSAEDLKASYVVSENEQRKSFQKDCPSFRTLLKLLPEDE
jgi:hypothetical protein